MNDIKTAKVLHLSDTIEEDIVECFINSCPHEIEIGKTYQAELTLNMSNSYQIENQLATPRLLKK
jgi:hypothetical protein